MSGGTLNLVGGTLRTIREKGGLIYASDDDIFISDSSFS